VVPSVSPAGHREWSLKVVGEERLPGSSWKSGDDLAGF
jgi:hypothetical protein